MQYFLALQYLVRLYKMQKHLRSIREGFTPGKLFFRKGDYFQDVADDLNDTIEHIEDGYKKASPLYSDESDRYPCVSHLPDRLAK